jgi:starch synthase
LARTAALFADKAVWKRLRRNAMSTDVSWRNPAKHYAKLYREAVAARG